MDHVFQMSCLAAQSYRRYSTSLPVEVLMKRLGQNVTMLYRQVVLLAWGKRFIEVKRLANARMRVEHEQVMGARVGLKMTSGKCIGMLS